MKKIFEDYGRVITVSIAILAIIGIIASLMPMVKDNYGSITTGFMNMADEAANNASGNGGGGGASNTPNEYGINIMQWDVSESQDNSVVANYYVKEENQTPPQTASINLLNVFKPMTVYAADEKTVVIDGVTYYLSDNDTVVITGNGRMMENLQSKLCNYSEIHRLTDEHFATEFQEFEYTGITFGVVSNGNFSECHYQTNSTNLVSSIKYQDNIYGIFTTGSYIGVFQYNSSTNSFITSEHLPDLDLEEKIVSFKEKVDEYMPTLVADNATVMPKNLIINEGVTNVGKNAFRNCTTLTNVTIPESCTSIDPAAFAYTSIETIQLPSNLQSIGGATFAYSKLKEINIPNSVTTLGAQTFMGCNNLENVQISENIVTIEKQTFQNCTNLTSVNIPDKVSSIKDFAFYNCSKITIIDIPDSVTSTGQGVFRDCSNLETVTISKGLTNISPGAFYNCSKLTNLVIPNNVTTISGNAFCGCSSLLSVTLPNNVTTINGNAFYGCSSLSSVTLPNSITSVGSNAFASMKSGSFIYCQSQSVADLLSGKYTANNTTVVVDASKF